MHPVKHHLRNKLIWMSRQLRKMNDAATITNWIAAMQSVYMLLDNFTENAKMVWTENQSSKEQKLAQPARKNLIDKLQECSKSKRKITNILNFKEEGTYPQVKRRLVVGDKESDLFANSLPIPPQTETPCLETSIRPRDPARDSNYSTDDESERHAVVASPPLAPLVVLEKEDPLQNEMLTEEAEQWDIIKAYIWQGLDNTNQNSEYYLSDPARIKEITRPTEKQFNMRRDDLLKNYRKRLRDALNEYFAMTENKPYLLGTEHAFPMDSG